MTLPFLDRVEDGLDARPGAGLPGLRFRLVEGDVGDEEDVGQADEEHLGPGREVQRIDLGREPLLGLPDVQDVRNADGPLLAGRPDEGEPPFELALDEQVLGQDDARGGNLADDADEALFELLGKLELGQGGQMTGLDLDPEGVGELLPQGLRAPVAAARLRPGAAALEEPPDERLRLGKAVRVEDVGREDGLLGGDAPLGGRLLVLDGQVGGGDDIGAGDLSDPRDRQASRRGIGDDQGKDGDEEGEEKEGAAAELANGRGLILLALAGRRGGLGPAGEDLGALEEPDLLKGYDVHGPHSGRVSAFW